MKAYGPANTKAAPVLPRRVLREDYLVTLLWLRAANKGFAKLSTELHNIYKKRLGEPGPKIIKGIR